MSQDTPPAANTDTVRTATLEETAPPPATTMQTMPTAAEGMSGGSSTDPSPMEPRLHREAVVLVHDRGRFAVLVSLCTLAGVAVGFVLGSFAGASAGEREAAQVVSVVPDSHEPDVFVAPPAPPTVQIPGPRHWGGGIDIWDQDPHGYLGVNLEDHVKGARVTGVSPGSAAARAGIAVGDIITAVDGESIATASQLARVIRDRNPDDEVTITLDRGGDEITLEAELGSRGGSSRIRIR